MKLRNWIEENVKESWNKMNLAKRIEFLDWLNIPVKDALSTYENLPLDSRAEMYREYVDNAADCGREPREIEEEGDND